MGNFRKKYTRLFFLSSWWPFVAVVAFLLILIIPNVLFWVHDAAHHAVPPFPASLFIWMGMAAIVLLIVIYGLVPPGMKILKELRAGKLTALLYDQGFILLTSKGDEQMVAHWPDIDVWHGVWAWEMTIGGAIPVPLRYFNSYTVVDRRTRASMKLLFGAEFTMAVEVAVATCQYPSVQAAYLSGHAVNFGRL